MIAYLSKSDSSEGFNQILDFLNGSSIKVQALVDKKKVVVTEAAIREGDDTAAHGEVPTITQEPSIPSPTLPTLPPQPPQDMPSTSHVQQTPPQTPQPQQQAADFPMSLFQKTLDACATLTRRVKHLELDKDL
nr:hypothetical protein [Tanacetum cinerariifolium]